MTRFVHIDYPTEHAGVVRAEAAYARGQAFFANTCAALGGLKNSVVSRSGLTLLALAAVVAAMVLVADRLVEIWAEDHLFAAWVALWTLIFATLAVFAPVAKSFVDTSLKELGAWREGNAARRADEAFLESAQSDPRVMAELRAAVLRHEAVQIEAFGNVEPNPALDRVMTALPANKRYLRYI
jgi:hypothetical protein